MLLAAKLSNINIHDVYLNELCMNNNANKINVSYELNINKLRESIFARIRKSIFLLPTARLIRLYSLIYLYMK